MQAVAEAEIVKLATVAQAVTPVLLAPVVLVAWPEEPAEALGRPAQRALRAGQVETAATAARGTTPLAPLPAPLAATAELVVRAARVAMAARVVLVRREQPAAWRERVVTAAPAASAARSRVMAERAATVVWVEWAA